MMIAEDQTCALRNEESGICAWHRPEPLKEDRMMIEENETYALRNEESGICDFVGWDEALRNLCDEHCYLHLSDGLRRQLDVHR